MNINQLKLEVHDTHKKDEKITTNFEPINNEDVLNKAYLDEKFEKMDGESSTLEKDYNEVKVQYNKQPVEDVLVQRSVKTTIRIYGRRLFKVYANADKI